jgi:hypothetical protein
MRSKNVMLFGFICLFFSAKTALAQPMEGVISYTIGYEVVEEGRIDLELYKTMLPQKLEFLLKDKNSLLKFEGGMTEGLLGDMLYQSKRKMWYSIFHHNKTVIQLSESNLKSTAQKTVFQAVKTQEISILLGHHCTRYVVKDTSNGSETSLWCTTSIPNASSGVLTHFLENMTLFDVAGLEGFPLKIEFKSKEFDLTLLAEKMEQKKLSKNLFEIPKGYKLSESN